MSARIMAWNIQNFGEKKAANNTILKCIAQTIVDNNVDIFIVLELRNITALLNLHKVLKRIKVQNAYPYSRSIYFFSPKSETQTIYTNTGATPHFEYYGFIFKNAGALIPRGFTGPFSTKDDYCVAPRTNKTLQILTGPTECDNDAYQNSFYLYNQQFSSGRPPCWVVYQDGMQNINIIAAHLRPNDIQIRGQIADLLHFNVVSDISKPLLFVGDINTQSEEILKRNVDNSLAQTVTEQLKTVNLEPAITREGTGTHISGSILDNAYGRRLNYTNISWVVKPGDIVNNLKNIKNAESDLNSYIEKNYKTFLSSYPRFVAIQNFFSNAKPSNDDIYYLFSIISDHYPIFNEISVLSS